MRLFRMVTILCVVYGGLVMAWACSPPTSPTSERRPRREANSGSEQTQPDAATPEPDTTTKEALPEPVVEPTPEAAASAIPALKQGKALPALGASLSLQIQPSVAFGADGKLGVAFTGANDSKNLGIYFALYDKSGTIEAKARLLDTFPNASKNESTLCALKGGGYVAVWSMDTKVNDPDKGNLRIHFRIVNAKGEPQGQGDSEVRTAVKGNHWLGHVACDTEGGFVVTGVRTDTDGKTFGVFYQRFDAQGKVLGKAVTVNPKPEGGQVYPIVATNAQKGVIVGWDDRQNASKPEVNSIKFRMFPDAFISPPPVREAFGSAQQPATGVHLVADPASGRIWVAGTYPNRGLALRAFAADGTKGIVLNYSDSAGTAYNPRLTAVGTADAVGLIYLRRQGRSISAIGTVLGDKETLRTPVVLATGNLPAYRPSVAYREGALAFAWTERTDAKAYAVSIKIYED